MQMRDLLRNYNGLLAKVDDLCRRIATEFAGEIACRPGCAGCCRHLSLFPVEAFALADALSRLSPEEAAFIRQRGRASGPDAPCPLLADARCLLYPARPLICRTHGLPLLLTADNGSRSVDFCPDNFQGLATLPGHAVIDLDVLNRTLTSINALFIENCRLRINSLPDRLTIAEALLIDFPTLCNTPRQKINCPE